MAAIPAPTTKPSTPAMVPVAVDEISVPPALERIRIYVWQIPVRVTHWVTFFAIVVLTITGGYIGDPFLLPGTPGTMQAMRFIHIIAAFTFVASGVLRTYWLFAGNQFARWRAFVPTNRRHWQEFVSQTKFYLFLNKDLPGILGHNALAGGTYLAVFFLFLVQTLTGFGLEAIHGSQPWSTLFGWVPALMFGEQGIRLIHHLLMWLIIAFSIHHVYSALLVDHLERNGLLSSIFSGSKFVQRWRIDEARDGGMAFEQLVRRQDIVTSLQDAVEAGQPITEPDVEAYSEAEAMPDVR
jgi:Ni/Fe-hydrogenase 1 B-type cytochrome subunit